MAGFCKDSRIVCRKSVLFLITGLFHFAKLRLFCFDLFNPCIRDMDWRQVRIWEIPVVFGILFGTHCIRMLFVVIPASRLLNNFLSGFQKLNLTLPFSFDGSCNCLKGVQVLHLRSCSEFTGSHFTNGQVHVRSHRALLQFAVRSTKILNRCTKFFQICNNFLRRAHIRLRYNLHKRYTASVVIYQ